MKKRIRNFALIAFCAIINRNAVSQSNLQIIFNAGTSALAGEDTVYMYSGLGTGSPGVHWQYTTGELVQPGTGLGFMTSLGQNIWGICLEPYSFFSQGTGGPVPNGATIYNLDMMFHNPGAGIILQNNPQGAALYLDMSTVPPTSNWVMITANFQNCTLGIDELPFAEGMVTNIPNPLVNETRFTYSLQKSGQVELSVFNSIGQKVATVVKEKQVKGIYSYQWKGLNENGEKLYNGLYYYSLTVDGKTRQVNKLVISR